MPRSYPRTTTVLVKYDGLIDGSTGKYIDDATIAASIIDSAGSLVTSSNITLTAAGWGGNYSGDIPSTISLTEGTNYELKYTITSGSVVRTRYIPITAVDDDNTTSNVVVVNGPMSTRRRVLVVGDSYLISDQSALPALAITRDEAGIEWPDTLSGWTLACTINYVSDNVDVSGTTTTLSVTPTALANSGPFQACAIEFTAAQTALFYAGTAVYRFKVTATNSTTKRTLATRTLDVVRTE